METWLPVIIQLVAGALGGNLVGSATKSKGLGGAGNTIAGALGGLGGGQLLAALGLGSAGSALDLTSIISHVVGGGVGGAILAGIVGMLTGGAKKV
ncbi:MAG: hypothetical protein R6W77_16580 [Trueperaceae bacterium]